VRPRSSTIVIQVVAPCVWPALRRAVSPLPDSCGAANTGYLDDPDCGAFHEQRGRYILLGAARFRHPYD
jgi:hypothetical protein